MHQLEATFPLTFEQLKLNFDNRSDCTVFLSNETVVAFANLYDIEGRSLLAVHMEKAL